MTETRQAQTASKYLANEHRSLTNSIGGATAIRSYQKPHLKNALIRKPVCLWRAPKFTLASTTRKARPALETGWRSIKKSPTLIGCYRASVPFVNHLWLRIKKARHLTDAGPLNSVLISETGLRRIIRLSITNVW